MGCKRASFLLLIPQLLAACNCLVSRSTCQEVANGNLVFIGTVESIEPSLLDYWKPWARRDWLQDPELVALRKNKSEPALRTLKDRYLKLLFDLPDFEKSQIQSAATQERLQAVMIWVLSQGTRIRFKVRTTFQRKQDSDSDDKDSGSDKKDDQFAEVWNGAGDCGVSFQKGETYLVYATDDEETDRMETSICHRTARLSDSGEDLAYLDFFRNGGQEASRLEGFVTSEIAQLHPDQFRYTPRIKSPVSDVIVELKSADGSRYTEPDKGGRFVFDGLAEGDYPYSNPDFRTI